MYKIIWSVFSWSSSILVGEIFLLSEFDILSGSLFDHFNTYLVLLSLYSIEDWVVKIKSFTFCWCPLLNALLTNSIEYLAQHGHDVMVVFCYIFFGDFNLKTFLNEINSKLFQGSQTLLYFLDYLFLFELTTKEHGNGIFMALVGHF